MTNPPIVPLKPCAEWAEQLAAPLADLRPGERDALERHVAVCTACAAAREDFRAMDTHIQGLPPVQPLPGLPPRLLRLWEAEDRELATRELDTDGADEEALGADASLRTPTPTAARRWYARQTMRALAAVLIVGGLLGGYFLLIAGRGAGPTTGGKPNYGPRIDPPGPHLGAWRTVTLPPGSPDRRRGDLRADRRCRPPLRGRAARGGWRDKALAQC